MFYVYLIESIKFGTYYVGQTNDVQERINNYHNHGRCTYTKQRMPWKLLAYKSFNTRAEAMKEEKKIKKLKSRIQTLKAFGLEEV